MKTLLLLALMSLFSAEAFACSCSKDTLDEWEPIQSYIKKNYGADIDLEKDVKWFAYYPGLLERVFAGEMRGSSCEGHGPQGELYLMCQPSRKSDYVVTIPDTNCTVKLRVKANYKRVKIRELKSTCKI
jgi:hypothetical protein